MSENFINLNKVIEKVNKSDLIYDSSSVIKLLTELNNPNSTAKSICDAIELIPPLASKVLQMANSPYYGGHGRISSIKKAITWIGFSQIKSITLNLSIKDMYDGTSEIMDYSRAKLWEHSVATALLAKQIARKLHRQRGDLHYAIGILHNLGFLIIDYFFNDTLQLILQSQHLKNNFLVDVEQQFIGFSHVDLSAALLRSWAMPEDLVIPINYYSSPFEAPEEYFENSAILFIADYLLNKAGVSYKEDLLLDTDMFYLILEKLKWDEESLNLLIEEVFIELEKLKEEGWL